MKYDHFLFTVSSATKSQLFDLRVSWKKYNEVFADILANSFSWKESH